MMGRGTSRGPNLPGWAPQLEARASRSRSWIVGAAVFLLSGALSYALASGDGSQPPAEAPPSAPAPEVEPAEAPPSAPAPEAEPVAFGPDIPPPASHRATLSVMTGRIPKGGTLAKALKERGVDTALVYGIADGLSSVFSFQNARADDFFALIQDDRGGLISFEFQRGRREVYRLDRAPDGSFRPSHEVIPLDRRVVQLAGIIESSLFNTVLEQGEGPELVSQFADVFLWDFDFARQTRPGDEVRIVYEKFYDRAGFVRYGSILAAQYRNSQREFTAVYYEDERGSGDYYTLAGRSVRRQFLRAPLRYSRISSRYSNSRLHPILKVRRPHRGIDYAAPSGTPVWAVADGEVIFRGHNGGFGRLVKIRHDNGYVTYYGHLRGYGKSMRVGQRVSQKQVIGYVGASGLATGPHLDYRIKVGKRFVDPAKMRFPKGQSIRTAERAQFDAVARNRLSELSSVSPPLVLEAAM